jgi:hypothetical protein
MVSQIEEQVEALNRDGVHQQLKHASELVFMDSSGTCDRDNCRIFLLLTHSCAGGLPLGCFITTSESREVIQLALNLYNSLLNEKCFHGRGLRGPLVFLTDDCAAERKLCSLCILNAHQSFASSMCCKRSGDFFGTRNIKCQKMQDHTFFPS